MDLQNKTIVFSGHFETMTQDQLAKLASFVGVVPRDTISGLTDYVVVGTMYGDLFSPPMTEKLQLANKMGIPLITEVDFLNYVVDTWQRRLAAMTVKDQIHTLHLGQRI
ncbi:hypothetical protein LH991_04290 [Schleiferilactobacillus harbinensis]|uniref:BRCT domain-containing protein n=1 Tax=Schleiferilactobacillus harbinensis DSM 16991 TaxID=1122147 RepID=A0A0R1XFC0_9LACO|nr:BRCT domain-containing protein [Schleiferilactobacillus harbinensis]KRM28810.1 hypothetical protein FC91_GL001521 [Schleiferilactobacillus harbinensis DSM 16991]QFR63249.1 hypothetical protein LH991_04290 [Schleiferilactobacillus harbinensis]